MVLGGRPPGRVERRRNYSINNPGFGRGCLHFRAYLLCGSLHLLPMSERRPSNSGRPERGSGPRRSGDSRPGSFSRGPRSGSGGRDDRPGRFDRDSRPPRRDGDDRPARSFDRDSRPPRRDGDDRPARSFDRDSRPPRGGGDDRPRRFDRDSRPPRSFDRDSRPPRRDGDDRPARSFDRDSRPPRSFDRDSRAPRGGGDDRPRRFDRDDRPARSFDRDSRPNRTAAQERSDEVKGRIGFRRTSGEMSLPPERSREDWVDEGSTRAPRRATGLGVRARATGRAQKGGRKEVRALDSVVEQFEKALGTKASPRALKRYDAALQAFEAHRYDEARKILNPMSREYSEVAAVREMLGLCLYRGGQYKRALAELETALQLNPDWIFNHAVIEDCHRALGQHQMVEKYWRELQEASPHPELMAEGRIVMAGSMADRGQVTEAISLMEKAAGDMKRPSEYHLRQWFVIADLYDKEGNVIKARQYFERIAAIDPSFVDVAERLSTLGV